MSSKPTPQVIALQKELEKLGVTTKSEYWDNHKHVDLYLTEANIYIEVDGPQHLTNPKQIVADFKREHFSDIENFNTLHISNEIVDDPEKLKHVAEAIADVVDQRKKGVF